MSARPGKRPDRLTRRQTQILELAASGNTREEIAETLFVDVETVKSHLKEIRLRLGAANTCHAVAIALRGGMIE